MNKKTLFTTIIIFGFIFGFISTIIIDIRLISLNYSDVINSTTIGLRVTKGLLEYIFTIPFFIIILVYFRSDKTLKFFAVLIVIGRSIGIIENNLSYAFGNSGFITFLESITAFTSIGAIFFAVRLFYKELYDKKLPYFLIYISGVYFLTESGVSGLYIYLMYLFMGGVNLNILFTLLLIGVIIIEVISVRYLYDFYRDYKEKPKTEIVYTMDLLKAARDEKVLKE